MLSNAKSAVQIAPREGVSGQTLYRWRGQSLNAFKQGLIGWEVDREHVKGVGRLKPALAEREQVIRELTIANRV
jgi:hypothetical protein